MGRPKVAANRLEQARADLAEADERIREVEGKRREALLRDNDTEAAKLDTELEQLRRLARGHGDKIGLLEAAAADEENAARVREHESLISRVERKLSERQELVVAMAGLVPEPTAYSGRSSTRVARLTPPGPGKARIAWPCSYRENAPATT